MQELDHLEVAVLRGVVHRVVRATPPTDLVEPFDNLQVAVQSCVVHGADATTLLPVLVQPLDDIEVSVGCRSIHGFAGTALCDSARQQMVEKNVDKKKKVRRNHPRVVCTTERARRVLRMCPRFSIMPTYLLFRGYLKMAETWGEVRTPPEAARGALVRRDFGSINSDSDCRHASLTVRQLRQ